MTTATEVKLAPLWRRVEPLGYAGGLVSFASVAAPLLTGFALTTVVELTGRSTRGTRGDLAIAAFAVASVLLIYAIQVGLAAGQVAVPPDQRVAQTPEARLHPEWADALRADQWRDAGVADRLFRRTRVAYNAGIIAFLLGLIAALIPGPGDWDLWRSAAVVVAGAAVGLEIVLAVQQPAWLSDAVVPHLPGAVSGAAGTPVAEPMDGREVQEILFGADALRSGPVPLGIAELTAQLAALSGQIGRLEATIADLSAQDRS